jgi:hypothetical protein
MTTALLDPDARTSISPAQWLRETAAAVRVSFMWMGVRKTLTQEQKNQAAESFGAEGDFLSARKKLLDTKHTAYKAVTALRAAESAAGVIDVDRFVPPVGLKVEVLGLRSDAIEKGHIRKHTQVRPVNAGTARLHPAIARRALHRRLQ